MQLVKTIFLFLTLTATTSSAEIFVGTSHANTSSSFADVVVDIVKSCYGNQFTTVGVAGESSAILIKKLSLPENLTLTLLDNTTRVVRNVPFSQKLRHRLQLFLITAFSSIKLKHVLSEMKSSRWWNHMASLLILDMPMESKKECSNAFEILQTAWKMNILHAKFICLHPTRGHLIYTYNPYTNNAPEPWQQEKIYAGKNDHPWTLLALEYRRNELICDKLDFDKTKDLGGFEIRATVKNIIDSWQTIPNKTGTESYGGPSGITARILFRALNATPILIYHTGPNGFSHDLNKDTDIAEDIYSGFCDIGLNFRYQLTLENLTTTYPFWYSGLSAVTQYGGYESQVKKIRSVVDVRSQYGVDLVLLITLIFFKFFRGQSLMQAILNTIRIICNSSLPKLPNAHAPRIYLASLYIFSITIQVIYQGELASMMMKRIPHPNVDSKQDLDHSGHMIHGYKSYARFFNEPSVKDRYVGLDDFDCTQNTLHDSTIACIMERQFVIDEAIELNLYLSSDIIVRLSSAYAIRADWPLEQRLNKILLSLVEADIIGHASMGKYRRASKFFLFNEKLKRISKFKIITLGDLTFAFIILGIGLGCATVCFIIEIAVYRDNNNVHRKRGRRNLFIEWYRSIFRP